MTFGFIILRHVHSKQTDVYWRECYDSIRALYPKEVILIIDDNSDWKYITPKKLYNTLVIHSEFPGRGEILPYYYFLKFNLFDTAVILHDSLFLKSKLSIQATTYQFLFSFEHKWDKPMSEARMIQHLSSSPFLLSFHSDIKKWKGCFGGMCVITHNFLKKVDRQYGIASLLNHIKTRDDRKLWERIIACMLQSIDVPNSLSLFGDIHQYMTQRGLLWGYTYEEYQKDKPKMPIVKVWTGR